MRSFSLICRPLVSTFLLATLSQLALAQTLESIDDAGASPTRADTNDPNRAVFPWGNPQFTDSTLNSYPRPAWVRTGCAQGGLWITNDIWYGWQPSLGDWQPELTTNRLLIQLDRALVSSILWIAVAGACDSNAVLLTGFYNDDLLAVSDPLVLHAATVAPWFTNSLNLSRVPSATIISISATNGMARFFSSVLYREDTSIVLDEPPAPPARTSPGFPTSTNTVGDFLPPSTVTGRGLPGDGSNAVIKATHTWYVNKTKGDDRLNNGTAAVRLSATSTGPKKTIAATLTVAKHGDTICVAAGVYPEHVYLGGVHLIANGQVILK